VINKTIGAKRASRALRVHKFRKAGLTRPEICAQMGISLRMHQDAVALIKSPGVQALKEFARPPRQPVAPAKPDLQACPYFVVVDGRAQSCGAMTNRQYCDAHRPAVAPMPRNARQVNPLLPERGGRL
jgi:hypothetical protein